MKGKIKLKVCGMRDHQNIQHVAQTQPEYLGFIFFPGSPRFVGNDFSMPQNLTVSIKKIGVFVNETSEELLNQIDKHQLDLVQLHGDESVEQVEILKKAGVDIIKVFRMDDSFDFSYTHAYQPYVDYFMFDTKGKNYGGNAQMFNWKLLERYNQQVPFFLSGGISPENVGQVEMFRDMNIHALDINSGVEISPGLKSIEGIRLIKEFLATI